MFPNKLNERGDALSKCAAPFDVPRGGSQSVTVTRVAAVKRPSSTCAAMVCSGANQGHRAHIKAMVASLFYGALLSLGAAEIVHGI